MERLKKNHAFLRYAASLPPGRERRELFRIASTEELKTICEICKNMRHGHLQMNFEQKKRFCKYKKQIRCLSEKNISLAKKRKLLQKDQPRGVHQQKGGFIGTLLGIALPLLASLIGKSIN